MPQDNISDDLNSALAELTQTANLPIVQGGRDIATRATDIETTARVAAKDTDTDKPEKSTDVALDRRKLDSDDEEDRTEDERKQLTAEEKPRKPAKDLAPVTWKDDAKKEWANLPASVKQDIQRRERQMNLTLTQTADQRRYADAMFNAIQPYEIHLRAEGVTHIQAVDYLMRMSHTMRAGTPQAKAMLMADLFFQHGVDLSLLDQYITDRIEGTPAKADPNLAALDAKLAPMMTFMNEMQQARQQSEGRAQQASAQSIQQLLDDPDIGDMIEDVRQDMADLLDLATKRGVILNLRDAAVRAIMAHPEHAVTYNQQQLAKQAQQQTEKAGRARRAGASLQDEGAPPASEEDGKDDDTILGALRASVRELSRRK